LAKELVYSTIRLLLEGYDVYIRYFRFKEVKESECIEIEEDITALQNVDIISLPNDPSSRLMRDSLE